jgi:hypothetical protein
MSCSDSPTWLPVGSVAATALGALAATLAAAPTAQAGATPQPVVARQVEAPRASTLERRAHEAFVARRYAEAYGRFAEQADEGHPPSAWMALLMVANGPMLFGGEWSATPGQLRRWNALATRHAQERSALIPVYERGE